MNQLYMSKVQETILKYKMTPMEAKAYKVCILWDKLARRELPNERVTRLKKTGDPRKSTLFRYCYKLITETKGLIEDKDYRLYLIAQFQILKLQKKENVHALIDPCILTGDKAWKRWKLWEKYYKFQLSKPKKIEEIDNINQEPKILKNLKATKEFLIQKNIKTKEDLKNALDNCSLIRWVTLNRISPYYAILSPWMNSILNGKSFEEVFLFDLSVYRKSITDEIQNWFKQEFNYEYH